MINPHTLINTYATYCLGHDIPPAKRIIPLRATYTTLCRQAKRSGEVTRYESDPKKLYQDPNHTPTQVYDWDCGILDAMDEEEEEDLTDEQTN